MKYVEVADALYGSSMVNILNIIENSQEAKHFDQKINSLVIHTGFVFFTLKQKKYMLLYDLASEKIIRQAYIHEQLPQLNGLLLAKINLPYFSVTIPMFFQQIMTNNEVYKYYKIEVEKKALEEEKITVIEKNKKISISAITVLKKPSLLPLKKYPLRRTFKEKITLDL